MAEKWRDFEKLVSRLERVLGPLGAVVKSPDRVLDSVTGRTRDALEHVVFRASIEEVFIWLYPKQGDVGSISLDPSVEGDAQVFSYIKENRKFRPSEILDMLIRNGQIQLPESAENPAILYTAIIKFEKGLFEIPTMVGFRGVSRLKLGFRINNETISSALPAKGFSYQGSVRPTVLGIESQTDVLGNQVLVSIHQQPGSNLLSITVTNKISGDNRDRRES